MNLFLPCVFVSFAHFTACMPLDNDKDAKVLTYENTKDEDNNYRFAYDLSNGIQQSEVGTITGKGTDNEVLKVQGFYTFVAPDGKRYIIRYTADENGFVPSITETKNTDDQSKLEESLNEFPDNIGTALLATLNGG